MDEFRKRILGRTGLQAGRLGLAASYGAPTEAFEEAFDHGCNYFYLGSGRHRKGMKQAIRNLCSRGLRDKLIVAVHTYARSGLLTYPLLNRTLRSLDLDYADILILGWHNRPPSLKLLDRAGSLKEKGLFHFLGMSGHNRRLFPDMETTGRFDIYHIRYNAAHRRAEEEAFSHLAHGDPPGLVTYTATRWGDLLKSKNMPSGMNTPSSSDCYRFVLSNPAVDVCLCGPKDIRQMRAALPALDLGPLDDKEMTAMKTIGDHVHQNVKRITFG